MVLGKVKKCSQSVEPERFGGRREGTAGGERADADDRRKGGSAERVPGEWGRVEPKEHKKAQAIGASKPFAKILKNDNK